MELNRYQIIKALEWCSELRLCVDCPMRAEGYFSHSGNACRKALMENALALIKELTKEVENYRQAYREIRVILAEANNDNKQLTVELEAMRGAANSYKMHYENVKADTVRKIKTLIHNNAVYPSTKGDVAYISLKSFDSILQNYLNGIYEGNKGD